MRVTHDALAVGKLRWMLGDSAYDILDWHDLLRRRANRSVQPAKH